ncbi:metal ABC transporter solute-binding protein, Zn/Mn family [Nocardia terpenica]|nr:zinc ABC transporter substrate-binding protein [Nocardia terpenica]NQE88248.1 zinc ABC transporter solute-binding protein [Nocardia terpenica]
MIRSSAVRSAVAMGVLTVALTACGGPKTDSGRLTIVASTSVWGSIAAAIAGPDVRVESIIGNPADDPHSYSTTPSDAAKIHDAALVVLNGGGYDEFAQQAAAGRGKPTIDAFATRVSTDDNEHVWYDTRTVDAVSTRIATTLGTLDAAHARDYIDRADAFRAQLKSIDAITAGLAAAHPRTPVLQTEPLAHYLLRAADADDRTPRAFAEAIEQGTDPAPAVVAAVRNMMTAKQVRALIYNIQTEDKTTRDIAAAARSAGVPVVEVTETLPRDTDYIRWQTANAQALAHALA